ncbi:MAG: ADP-ribosylglycohydrolase family protein [Candidatus Fimivivens sp.]|nr:ADP-ribosylglycohydrolase family protein [Candidatus Fimivivens sp.]
MARKTKLTDAVLGFIVGDALGVPVEFKTRVELDENPVVDMRGFGTHNQPPGTWSDDTSMTLATIENLADWKQPEPYQCMVNFSDWLFGGHFTPYEKVFDVGNTTKRAITNFVDGVKPWGLNGEYDNGNGALMRMLPLAFLPLDITDKLQVTREYAALTHGHELNLLACEFFVEMVDTLNRGVDDWLKSAYSLITFRGDPTGAFARILRIGELTRDEIKSTGYVIDTLEAALWCFITTDNYRDAVLTAVNLGGDTDTIAAITGGLAGLKYGEGAIPGEWLKQIARLPYIRGLLSMAEKYLVHGRFKMVQG